MVTFQHLQHRLLHALGVTQDLNNLNREGKLLLLVALTMAMRELSPEGPPDTPLGDEVRAMMLSGISREMDHLFLGMTRKDKMERLLHLCLVVGRHVHEEKPVPKQVPDHHWV